MKESQERKWLKEYEKEGYRYFQFEPEECDYHDSETGETGKRLVIHIGMDKPDKSKGEKEDKP